MNGCLRYSHGESKILNRNASTLTFFSYDPIISEMKMNGYGMPWLFVLNMKSEHPGMILPVLGGPPSHPPPSTPEETFVSVSGRCSHSKVLLGKREDLFDPQNHIGASHHGSRMPRESLASQ